MGCNCGKNRATAAQPRTFVGGSTTKYALIERDGSRTEYGSRLEADAANARSGYTGIVKPVGGV